MIQSKANLGRTLLTIIILCFFLFQFYNNCIEYHISGQVSWRIIRRFMIYTVVIALETTTLIDNLTQISVTFEKIVYKNFLTGKTNIYKLESLDGFITITSRFNEIIYLTKGKKRCGKINKINYRNYEQLKEALFPLKYLGAKPYSFFAEIKEYFT